VFLDICCKWFKIIKKIYFIFLIRIKKFANVKEFFQNKTGEIAVRRFKEQAAKKNIKSFVI
jgi:hypothetical protein